MKTIENTINAHIRKQGRHLKFLNCVDHFELPKDLPYTSLQDITHLQRPDLIHYAYVLDLSMGYADELVGKLREALLAMPPTPLSILKIDGDFPKVIRKYAATKIIRNFRKLGVARMRAPKDLGTVWVETALDMTSIHWIHAKDDKAIFISLILPGDFKLIPEVLEAGIASGPYKELGSVIVPISDKPDTLGIIADLCRKVMP